VRLFVAVVPPGDVLDRLAALRRPPRPGVRWTRREQWHVTLRFLGEVDESAVPALVAALDAAPLAGGSPAAAPAAGGSPAGGPPAGGPPAGGSPAGGAPAGGALAGGAPAGGPLAAGPVGSAQAAPGGDHGPVPPVAVLGPRVTALGRRVVQVPVAGLDDLAAAVEAATATVGRPPEPRSFRGHVTLARVARGSLRDLVGEPVAATFPVGDVRLVHSRPGGRDGPVYADVHIRPLV